MIIKDTQTKGNQNRPMSPVKPLDLYNEGDTVIITNVRGGRGLNKRLKEMGLGIGEIVTIIKNHRPGGLVLEVMDSKLCIGRGIANKIRAEEKRW
jgi:ferrous iron transport protein A